MIIPKSKTLSSAGVIFFPDFPKKAKGQMLWMKQFLKKFSGVPQISSMTPQNFWPLCSTFVQLNPSTGLAASSFSGLYTCPVNCIQSRTLATFPKGT